MSDDKRNFGLRFEKLSSRPADDGGFIQRGGSRDADTQYPSINSNVVFLPRVMATRRPSNLPASPPAFYSVAESPLEVGNFAQTMLDIGALISWIILLIVAPWAVFALIGFVLLRFIGL